MGWDVGLHYNRPRGLGSGPNPSRSGPGQTRGPDGCSVKMGRDKIGWERMKISGGRNVKRTPNYCGIGDNMALGQDETDGVGSKGGVGHWAQWVRTSWRRGYCKVGWVRVGSINRISRDIIHDGEDDIEAVGGGREVGGADH